MPQTKLKRTTNSAAGVLSKNDQSLEQDSPLILEQQNFTQLGVTNRIKQIHIYHHWKVILVNDNDESIEVPPEAIELPAYKPNQLKEYLQQATVAINECSDGSYGIKSHLRVSGGGKTREIHTAVKEPNVAKVKKIINTKILQEKRYDIDVLDENNNTPLTWACNGHWRYCNLDIVKLLVEAGANPNIKNNEGYSAFLLICYQAICCSYAPSIASHGKHFLDIAFYLLNTGKIDPKVTDKNGDSALMYACGMGNNLTLAKLLIEAGADVNTKNNSGNNVFHLACAWGYLDIVSYLLTTGKVDTEVANNEGRTALIEACKREQPKNLSNYLPIIEQLIKAKANVNVVTNEGDTPLTWACCAKYSKIDFNIVKCLVEAGADVNHITKNRWTPLCLACDWQDLDTVTYLAPRVKEIDTENSEGKTPLAIACVKGNKPMIRLLVEHGADPAKVLPSVHQNLSTDIKYILETANPKAQAVEVTPKASNELATLSVLEKILDFKARGELHKKEKESFETGMVKFNAKNYDEAILYFNEAIKINPFNAEYLEYRGHACAWKANFIGAIHNYEDALLLDPNRLNLKVEIQKHKKFYDEFIKSTDRAISDAQSDIKALMRSKKKSDVNAAQDRKASLNHHYQYSASLYVASGNYQAAAANLRQIGDLNSLTNSAPAFMYRGICYARFGQIQEAIADLTQAINLLSKTNDLQKIWLEEDWRACYELGLIYRAQGNSEAAVTNFKKADEYRHPEWGSLAPLIALRDEYKKLEQKLGKMQTSDNNSSNNKDADPKSMEVTIQIASRVMRILDIQISLGVKNSLKKLIKSVLDNSKKIDGLIDDEPESVINREQLASIIKSELVRALNNPNIFDQTTQKFDEADMTEIVKDAINSWWANSKVNQVSQINQISQQVNQLSFNERVEKEKAKMREAEQRQNVWVSEQTKHNKEQEEALRKHHAARTAFFYTPPNTSISTTYNPFPQSNIPQNNDDSFQQTLQSTAKIVSSVAKIVEGVAKVEEAFTDMEPKVVDLYNTLK